MGCCKILCKILLILINIIFLILGIIFFIPGVMIKSESSLIKDQIDPFLDTLNDAVKDSGYVSSDEKIDFAVIFEGLSTGLIVLGVLLIFLTIAVMIGSCCLNIFLIIYAVFVSLIILTQVILLGMLYTGKFDTDIQNRIQKTITEEYVSTDSFTIDSVLINFMQMKFECCGVNNYQDYHTPPAQKWKKQRDQKITVLGNTQTVSVILSTPISCCKMTGSFPSVEPVAPQTCATVPTELTSNFKIGCWNKIEDEIKNLKGNAVGGTCGIIGFELILVILSIIAFVLTKKEKEQKVGIA